MENTNNKATQDVLNMAHGFEKQLVGFFAQFPHLPEGGRKVLVQIVPWLALIGGVLSIVGFLAILLGIGTIAGLSGTTVGTQGMLGAGVFGLISTILGLIVAILEVSAFTLLKEEMKKGWNFLFYGLLIGAISTIVNILGSAMYGYAIGSFIGGVLSFLIGGWLLFEIRSHFTK